MSPGEARIQPESRVESRWPYNTSTAFSPTDAAPLTQRAKVLMMFESAISMLTLVVVVSRAINVLPG